VSDAINLSGIQSLEIPASLFDEFFKYDGNTFSRATYPEGDTVAVQVVHEKENAYQTKEEPALAVKLDNCTIGYIPVLSTIERYINAIWKQRGEAMAAGNKEEETRLFKKWEWQNDRYTYARIIRDNIETDLFINNDPFVPGTLSRVQLSDGGDVLSISVLFNHD
jgi:hypothetical protein